MRTFECEPSLRTQATVWPFLSWPENTRSSAMRPRNGEASRLVTQACSGASSSYDGAGTCLRIASNSGSRSSLSGRVPFSGLFQDAAPLRPEA